MAFLGNSDVWRQMQIQLVQSSKVSCANVTRICWLASGEFCDFSFYFFNVLFCWFNVMFSLQNQLIWRSVSFQLNWLRICVTWVFILHHNWLFGYDVQYFDVTFVIDFTEAKIIKNYRLSNGFEIIMITLPIICFNCIICIVYCFPYTINQLHIFRTLLAHFGNCLIFCKLNFLH